MLNRRLLHEFQSPSSIASSRFLSSSECPSGRKKKVFSQGVDRAAQRPISIPASVSAPPFESCANARAVPRARELVEDDDWRRRDCGSIAQASSSFRLACSSSGEKCSVISPSPRNLSASANSPQAKGILSY